MRLVNSINNYLSGIKTSHLYAGGSPTNLKEFQIQLTLKGIKLKVKHSVRRAKAITPKLLKLIYSKLNPKNHIHTVFWSVILTGFYLLLQKSHLVRNNCRSFNPKHQVTRNSIKLKPNYVQVVVTWSKTIQFNDKKLVLKMFAIPGCVLCPVKAFTRLFRYVKAEDTDAYFLCPNGKPFSDNMLKYYLHKCLSQAGVKNVSHFSSHSLRTGGLSWGYRIGLSKNYLKSVGDWKSDCYEVYLTFPKQVRDSAALPMRNTLTRI